MWYTPVMQLHMHTDPYTAYMYNKDCQVRLTITSHVLSPKAMLLTFRLLEIVGSFSVCLLTVHFILSCATFWSSTVPTLHTVTQLINTMAVTL